MKTSQNNGTTASQVKSMTKAFVAYTLGTESTWKPGDKATFQFLFRNCNSAWEMTLAYESEDYAPFAYRLEGRQLTFEGHKPEYPATWGRRYYTMEKAFLHILNHFISIFHVGSVMTQFRKDLCVLRLRDLRLDQLSLQKTPAASGGSPSD